jgi:hypothetical protein
MSIDWDEVKRQGEERKRRNMESFAQTFDAGRKPGEPKFEDIMGVKKSSAPPPPREARVEVSDSRVTVSQNVADAAKSLVRDTEDDTPGDVMRRALGVYTAAVNHAKGGGEVRFVYGSSKEQFLGLVKEADLGPADVQKLIALIEEKFDEGRNLKVRLREIPEVEAELVE